MNAGSLRSGLCVISDVYGVLESRDGSYSELFGCVLGLLVCVCVVGVVFGEQLLLIWAVKRRSARARPEQKPFHSEPPE